MRRPDFFVVGAPKCGTSWLTHYLNRHPDIFMPEGRDPTYFGGDLYKEHPISLPEYLALFRGAGDADRVGETSVWYLYSKRAAREIRAFAPDARVVVMLRDPVEKMYSHHAQLLYSGNEDIADFEAALDAEPARRAGRRVPPTNHRPEGLLYRETARFAEQVERYRDVFGWERLHVVLYDDLASDPAGTYRRVLEFLGARAKPMTTDFEVVNASKRARSERVRDLVQGPPGLVRAIGKAAVPAPVRRGVRAKVRRLNTRYETRPPMDPGLRRRLREEFAPEVARLGELLGRDLSRWGGG